MKPSLPSWRRAATCAAILLWSAASLAQDRSIIYITPKPGGIWGNSGLDVSSQQKVANRFSAPRNRDVELDRIGLYLMSNATAVYPQVTVSLRTDARDEGGKETLPSEVVLESWTFNISAQGWDPVQEYVTSVQRPLLQSGRDYWVVAESSVPSEFAAVWNFAASGLQYMTTTLNGVWQPAVSAAALSLRVEARDAPQLPTVEISVSPSRIRVGSTAQLQWTSTDTSSCRASGDWKGAKALQGSQNMRPSAPGTYVYQLSCSGAGGSAEASTTLRVLP